MNSISLMAVQKKKTAQAKKTSPATTKPRSPAAKKGGRSGAASQPVAKGAAKKRTSRAAATSSAKKPATRKKPASAKAASRTGGREPRARLVHAVKKVIDDIAANKKVARTTKATQEMAHQLFDRAEHIVKDAASASSETVGKARQTTRRTAFNFVHAAKKFLESVEEKIEETPTGKKAGGKRRAGKAAPAKKPATRSSKKKTARSGAAGKA